MAKTKCIQVKGVLEAPEALEFEAFWETFIALIESKGWTFCGPLRSDPECEGAERGAVRKCLT